MKARHCTAFVASSVKDGVGATGRFCGERRLAPVLHPAVGKAELHQRLELLGHDRLTRVRSCREIQLGHGE
jgi:hypothetical protein